MSARPRRTVVVPVLAGLCTAAVAFAVVLLATRDEARPAPAPAPKATSTAGSAQAAGTERGRAVYAAAGCGSCHRLAAAGSEGEIGPPLDPVLPNHTRASLRAKIVNPDAGSPMPGDFGRRLSAADLAALVGFLLAERGAAR
jgi:mono/diheme cytochrome c family protein